MGEVDTRQTKNQLNYCWQNPYPARIHKTAVGNGQFWFDRLLCYNYLITITFSDQSGL